MELKERTLITVNTCFGNMKTLGFPKVPLPSVHLLQGGRRFSHSSSEKSSSRCLASEKRKENERK